MSKKSYKDIMLNELSRVEKGPLSWFTKVIIVEKSIKVFVLGLLAISIFPIFSDEMIEFLREVATQSHILSSVRVINFFIAHVEDASSRRLASFSFLFFLWGILELSEAIGLWKKRRWAEYLAVVGTGIFIPIEAYTVLSRFSFEKFTILVFNIVLVVYLIWSHKLFFIQDSSHA